MSGGEAHRGRAKQGRRTGGGLSRRSGRALAAAATSGGCMVREGTRVCRRLRHACRHCGHKAQPRPAPRPCPPDSPLCRRPLPTPRAPLWRAGATGWDRMGRWGPLANPLVPAAALQLFASTPPPPLQFLVRLPPPPLPPHVRWLLPGRHLPPPWACPQAVPTGSPELPRPPLQHAGQRRAEGGGHICAPANKQAARQVGAE